MWACLWTKVAIMPAMQQRACEGPSGGTWASCGRPSKAISTMRLTPALDGRKHEEI